MLTRHKGFQRAGQNRRGKKELRPLRRIVDYRSGKEVLECGHEQNPREDIAGPTNANRRRCSQCPKKGPTLFIQRGAPSADRGQVHNRLGGDSKRSGPAEGDISSANPIPDVSRGVPADG